jgi:hypothetical protein
MHAVPPIDLPRLWLPGLALSGCVRAAIVCNTGSLVPPGRAWRNSFPASPLVSLFWWLHGRAEAVVEPGFAFEIPGPFPGDLCFAGPFTRPS